MKFLRLLLLLLLLAAACAAGCSPVRLAETAAPGLVFQTPMPAPSSTPAPVSPTALPSPPGPAQPPASSPAATASATSTATATATATETPAASATATPIPTYVKLRGKVIIEQAVCHYGPGAPYLYKYGVYKGSNLEILRRVEYGNYIEIQAIGGNNPCWVREDYLEIKGSLQDLEPVSAADVRLPISPYYTPPAGVSARRDGNVVTIFWTPLALRPGDDSEQVPYIVEAWVCQNGQYVFIPAGSYQTALEIRDEPGCSLPSHGFLIAAEKHGYTRRVEIPWPPAEDS